MKSEHDVNISDVPASVQKTHSASCEVSSKADRFEEQRKRIEAQIAELRQVLSCKTLDLT